MKSPASNYFAKKCLDVIGGVSFTAPANLYLAALKSEPAYDDTGTTISTIEADYGGYSRLQIANNSTNFPEVTVRTKTNGTQLLMAEATSGSNVITHFALCDAASGGNVFMKGEISTPRTVTAGVMLRLEPGDITWTFLSPAE